VLFILFDFDYFSKIVERVYDVVSTPYTIEEVLSVFEYFFSAYETETGNIHPGIRQDQIAKIIKTMPYIDMQTHGMSADIEPEDYPAIIDTYFQTYFPNCDYRINHFFSGRVREIRFYENLY